MKNVIIKLPKHFIYSDKRIIRQLDKYVKCKNINIILDAKMLSFVESSAMGILISYSIALKNTNRIIKIINCFEPDIIEYFKILSVDKIIELEQ